MLEVDRLSKHYQSGARQHQVFDQLSFGVERAEVVALLGASGSGKTTLLNLLSGIDTPDAGQVRLDGREIHSLGEPARTLLRRLEIGFVFQFFNLIPTLTAAENLALPLELCGQSADQAQERASELLAQVGLAGMGARYPETLSGGEQQRTAVARALAHWPKLLLADEPTGNLDEATGDKLIGLLTGLARDQGTTMVIVTHSRAVADAADRVLSLHHGRLSEP